MSADMLTDMVDLLTNVDQYWPTVSRHIDRWVPSVHKVQEIYD